MYIEVDALLENTIFEARMKNGKIISYKIKPAEGYKLHEISFDLPAIDEETGEETEQTILGYTTAFVTAGANYDFITNDRQIYAVKE